MKRKNGFTLVEILVTISLLSLIMIIVVPSVISINKKVKNKLYSTKVSQAEEATILWVQDNHNCLSNDDDSCMIRKRNCSYVDNDENKIQCSITMEKLAENNLIKYDDEEKGEIYNPIDNSSMLEEKISFIYNLKTKLISINSKKTSTTETKNTTTITTTKKTGTTATKETSTTTTTKNTTTTTTTTKIVAKNENDCLNLYDEDSGTLLAAIKNNYQNAPIATKTTPGKQISAEDEAVLAATDDDYGYSLYFRGTATNNFVQFAGMCWRIVRITGDCSIKLVLYNYKKESSPCDAKNSSNNKALIDGGTQRNFNDFDYLSHASIGFMYGDYKASTYAEVHANNNISYALKILASFYDSNLRTYSSKLADTIWCNDKSIVNDTSYNPAKLSNIGNSVTSVSSYYNSMKRIVSSSNDAGGTGPSLVCPIDSNGGKLSKFTASDTTKGNGALTFAKASIYAKQEYKIGLLTVDEVVFAGGIYNRVNKNYYLYENTGYVNWWTMSPAYYNTRGYLFLISGLTGSIQAWKYGQGGALRPAISLVSTINISGGDGSSSKPFIIK
jgi:prepilin-type N-terminal cleavage/methylation domain-containing protein